MRVALASQPDQVTLVRPRTDDLRGRRKHGAGLDPDLEIHRLELAQELGWSR